MQIGANNWDVEIYKLERYMYFSKETKDFLTFFNYALQGLSWEFETAGANH